MKKLLLAFIPLFFAACGDCDDCGGPGESDPTDQIEVLIFSAIYYPDDGSTSRYALVAMNTASLTRADGEPDIRVLLDSKGDFREGLSYGSMGSDGKTLLFSAGFCYDNCGATYAFHIPTGRLTFLYGNPDYYRSSSRSLIGDEYGFTKPLFSPDMKEVYGLKGDMRVLSVLNIASGFVSPLFQTDLGVCDYIIDESGRELYFGTFYCSYCDDPDPSEYETTLLSRMPVEGRHRKDVKVINSNKVISIDKVRGANKLIYSELVNYMPEAYPYEEPASYDAPAISSVTLDERSTVTTLYTADAGEEGMINSVTVNRSGQEVAWIEYCAEEPGADPEIYSTSIMLGDYTGTAMTNIREILSPDEFCDCGGTVKFSMVNKALFESLPQLEECGVCQ